MKITKVFAVITLALALTGMIGTASGAAVNAVTPSTNDINRTNGWAHVDVVLVRLLRNLRSGMLNSTTSTSSLYVE